MNEIPILIPISITVLILLVLGFIVTFHQLLKDLPPKPEPLGKVSEVDVVAWVEIGETFEFGSTREIDLNDVVGIVRKRYDIPYGLAKIVEVGPGGFYKAKRID